jgi:hypothetical protein
MTTTERNALTPGASDRYQIYNSTTAQYEYWDGDSWEAFTGSGAGDNLGNHIATQDLDVNNFNIINNSSPNINLGQDDTSVAYLNVYGGSSVGAFLSLFNAAATDPHVDAWRFYANGDLQLRGQTASSVFTVDDVTQAITAPETDLADYATLGNKTLVTDERLQDQLSSKQDTLTAGANIEIDPNNVISVIGATITNTTVSAWQGEFNRTDFTFDRTTGILNQVGGGNTVFQSEFNDTFINGGAFYRVENYQTYQDTTDAINVVYMDVSSSSVGVLASSAHVNLPAIPSGRVRIVLGVVEKRGDNDYFFRSKYFGFPKEINNFYPFDNTIIGRDGDLELVTDIVDVKINLSHVEDAYDQYGRLKKIRPNFMTNNGLYRWQITDSKGVSLGFITTFTNPLRTGTVTIDCPEVSGAGMTLTVTQNFDVMPNGTQYAFSDNWFLDDSIMLEAIDRLNSVETSGFVTSNTGLIDINKGEDLSVALFGDSMMTSLIYASQTPNPENLPPSCQNKYVPYALFQDAVQNKPVYDRWDSANNTFTESGTFTDGDNFGVNNLKRGGEATRYSSTQNAYVEWSWDLSAYTNLNWIYATDEANTNNLTLTISTGNGEIEVYDDATDTWVEANNYTFNQIAEPLNNANGNTGYTFNNRLKLKRVATTGTPTIRVSKGANADVLYYWGTERYKGSTVWFGNEGYSSNNLSQLEFKYNSSLFSPNKNYNVILFEVPLINDSGANIPDLVNAYEDFIWGDRAGNLNPNSLKNRSNNWADFKLVLMIPPLPNALYDTDGSIKITSITAQEKWNAVIELFKSKGDVPYQDMNVMVQQESRLKGINKFELTNGNTTNYRSTKFITSDGVHYNDYGAKLLSKQISPIFW